MFILMINGVTPKPFLDVKKYDVGSGYIALLDKSEGCILCRYLNDYELELFEKAHYLYDCTNKPLTNATANEIGHPVLIIKANAKDFKETDIIVNSCEKAHKETDDVINSAIQEVEQFDYKEENFMADKFFEVKEKEVISALTGKDPKEIIEFLGLDNTKTTESILTSLFFKLNNLSKESEV